MSFRVKFHQGVKQMRSLEAEVDAWIETAPYRSPITMTLRPASACSLPCFETPPARFGAWGRPVRLQPAVSAPGEPVIGTLAAITRRIANDVFSPLARFLG